MAKKKINYYDRKWLNPKTGRAYIITSIDCSQDCRGYVDANLEIGDCSDTVHIELDFNVKGSGSRYDRTYAQAKAKLAVVRNALDKLEKEMDKASVLAKEHYESKEHDD